MDSAEFRARAESSPHSPCAADTAFDHRLYTAYAHPALWPGSCGTWSPSGYSNLGFGPSSLGSEYSPSSRRFEEPGVYVPLLDPNFRLPHLRELPREMVGEFLGTFVLVAIGCGVNATQALSGHPMDGGWFLLTQFGWALAVYLAILTSLGVSGAHLNPAVSLAFAAHGRFPVRKVLPYCAAQLLGTVCGAAVVYFAHAEGIAHREGGGAVRSVHGPRATAGIFATYAAGAQRYEGFGFWRCFVDETIGTALFMFLVFAISDKSNAAPGDVAGPFAIACAALAIGLSWSINTGAALNPARDLGPRLVTWAVGYGREVWTAHHYFCVIPLMAPVVGGVLGSSVYRVLIEMHHPDSGTEPDLPNDGDKGALGGNARAFISRRLNSGAPHPRTSLP